METTAMVCIGYAAWTILLVMMIGGYRVFVSATNRYHGKHFDADGKDVGPFSHRLCRAHANCYEAAPFIVTLMLIALITNHTEITNGLAPYLLLARIAQSITHMISIRPRIVLIRFAFFAVQVGISAWWVFQFTQHM